MPTNYKQLFARKRANEERIKKLCPAADHNSGIYAFYRIDENGFKFAYIGQSTKSLLVRLEQHLEGHSQHIDKSIKAHGLYDKVKNPYGYNIKIICHCPPSECDSKEQYYIKTFANAGWQMRNVTSGSQGVGKTDINERKPAKGYKDGLSQGYNNARKEVSHLFEKNLTYAINGKPTKNKEKAMAKFAEFIKIDKK